MKTRILLILFLLANVVNAADSGYICSSNYICETYYPTHPYCRGDSPSDLILTCHNDLGDKGKPCAADGDTSCLDGLYCEPLGTNDGEYWEYRCSECTLGMHINTGLPDFEGWEPYHAECETPGTTCSCDVKQSDSVWYSYGRFYQEDDLCDTCNNGEIGANVECWESFRCLEMQKTTRSKKCLQTGYGYDCCTDYDCNTGYTCIGNTCTLGATTTTTTATTTTGTGTTTTTTTTLISLSSECYEDEDCGTKEEYCSTGYNVDNVCLSKKTHYLTIGYFSDCHRNHECLSGICNVHNSNSVGGDYPVYSETVGDPYTNVGNCLPQKYVIRPYIFPQTLTQGQAFDMVATGVTFANITTNTGTCMLYFDAIDLDSQHINDSGDYINDVSWAYGENGNRFHDAHQFVYSGEAGIWNYQVTENMNVNATIGEGEYKFFVECQDNVNYGYGLGSADVFNANHTALDFDSSKDNALVTERVQFIMRYTNINNTPIYGAACNIEVEGTNFTALISADGNGYQAYKTFTYSGVKLIKGRCTKIGSEVGFTFKPFYVVESHCINGVKDGGETAIDCGGNCEPCNFDECTIDSGICARDNVCCNGWCKDGICRSPSCYDGVKNQGEVKVDCGGPCVSCGACLQDNDCSTDGRYICNKTTGSCNLLNCTTSAECPTLQWCTGTDCIISQNGVFIAKQTYCDTNAHVCTFYNQGTGNGTTYQIGLDITPNTGHAINISGTIMNILNCEDDNYGFTARTNTPSIIYYSFSTSPFSPSVSQSLLQRKFGSETPDTLKSSLIPELCRTVNGLGGIPTASHSQYARIVFTSYSGSLSNSQTVDVLVYRRSLKNDFNIFIYNSTSGTSWYLANATNRSIYLMGKLTLQDQFTNLSSTYIMKTIFNLTSILNGHNKGPFNVFYYRVNTSYGEVYEGRYGNPVWMFIEWDKDAGWFKTNFELQSWHIWIFLAAGICALAYANYRIQEKRQYGRGSQ